MRYFKFVQLSISIFFFLCNKKNALTVIYAMVVGVYGDVHRVKILFNKKDNALVQMADPHQAQLGKFCLIKHFQN